MNATSRLFAIPSSVPYSVEKEKTTTFYGMEMDHSAIKFK